MESQKNVRCGYISLIGRPNVGKSTLLNYLLEQKLSITSRKPQTTRHTILGIKTTEDAQFIFVDTPGQHTLNKTAINRYMNKVAIQTLNSVDVVVIVVDRLKWTEEDELVFERLNKIQQQRQQDKRKPLPVIVAINKIDKVTDKKLLLPHIEEIQRRIKAEVVPISALGPVNLEVLQEQIKQQLPLADKLYPSEQITDRSQKFLVAEIIREKIIRQLGDEMPYACTVAIESYKLIGKTTHIDALLMVERDGQKAILIGEKGARLKSIGTESRKDIERLVDTKVMLKLWAKVKSNWSDDERALQSLGYD